MSKTKIPPSYIPRQEFLCKILDWRLILNADTDDRPGKTAQHAHNSGLWDKVERLDQDRSDQHLSDAEFDDIRAALWAAYGDKETRT